MKYGVYQKTSVSRFLDEINSDNYRKVGYQECLGVDSEKSYVSQDVASATKFKNIIGIPSEIKNYTVGMRIVHDVWGEGIILKMDGIGTGVRAYINFEKYGEKCILPAFCKLKILEG
jgi:hypothetical protein